MAQPQPGTPGGFNWNNLSMGTKILSISSLVFLIVLFLPGWETYDTGLGNLGLPGVPGFADSVSFSAFSAAPGVSWLAFLFALAVVVWEGLLAFGVNISMGTMSPALLSAIGGGATALLGVICFLMSLSGVGWAAFVGLLASLAVGYGAFLRFNESKVGGAAPPPAA